jgi:hypothetical protein
MPLALNRACLAILAFLAVVVPLGAEAAQFGIYGGAGCQGVQHIDEFEKWLGRPVDRAEDFLAKESWDGMVSGGRWLVRCWSTARPKIAMTLSVPMLPQDRKASLAQVVAGGADTYFRMVGEALVRGGYADAVLRIGWEFNGSWYPWSVKYDQTNWVPAYRHIVAVFRGVPGSKFKFDWNPNLGQGVMPPDQFYPGDDVVDFIGLDVYNQAWGPGGITVESPQRRWEMYLKQPFGLDWLRTFAAQHKKTISIPEWGTGTRPDGHGGGDDPYFIEQMAAWMKANNVGYQIYFDYNERQAGQYKLSDGQYPKSAAAYRKAFGK